RSTSTWKPSTSRSRAARIRSRDWEFRLRHSGAMRQHRTRNLEVPGLVLAHHPGTTGKDKDRGNPMPVPQHVFDPPFNIIRSSHAVLDVTDLNASRAFYENAVGLHVEDSDNDVVYLRGSEEHQHHSLVLRKAKTAACNRLGFKVGNDNDLDKAAAF